MVEESSRICVKQLSKFMTEPKLREIFSKIGTVTDLKIVKTKDGRPRGFGFVGFKSADEARLAVRRLNKSYIGGGRIVVEVAKAVGDGALPRPWSKYTPGSSKYAEVHGDTEKEPRSQRKSEEEEDPTGVRGLIPRDDPLYREFAGVMGGGEGNKSTWSNDVAGQGATSARPGRGAASASSSSSSSAAALGGQAQEQEGTTSSDDGSSSSDDSDSDSDSDSGSDDGNSVGGDSGAGAPAAGLSEDNLAFLRQAKGPVSKDADGGEAEASDGSVSGSGSDSDGSNDSSDSDSDGDGDSDEDEGGDFQVVDGELKPAARRGKKRSRQEMGRADGGDSDSDSENGDGDDYPEFDESRLFVRNMPYAATEAEVQKHFGEFGVVKEVVLPRDASGKGKGICFVSFEDPASAARAMHSTDGKVFMGRLVHVMPARPPPKPTGGYDDSADGTDGWSGGDRRKVGQSTYKAQLEAKRKEAARSGRESNVWNTLLVRSDVALASAAKASGAAEDEVMDKTASNPAVRLALGETAVIEETKGFLRQEGVDLEVMERGLKGLPVPRSDSVILVKQLPPDVEREAVRSLFSRFGPLVRCVMPPAKSICLVEFEQPRAAKKAFRSLAYTRFMRVPLYLEWAPDQLFEAGTEVSERSAGGIHDSDMAGTAVDSKARASTSEQGAEDEGKQPGDGSAEGGKPSSAATAAAAGTAAPSLSSAVDGKTIFVKNLAFATTQQRLKELADTVGKTRAVHIPTRTERRGGKDVVLSMGYGFVEYTDKQDALEAIKRLQGAMLDGHSIELKLSRKQAGPSAAHRASASAAVKELKEGTESNVGQGSKLLVKNLAFEATRQDLRELFGAFGKLQSVRVPRRHDGYHRGFGFVDFASAEDARTAADKLGATHLYGRKLVIAWPNAETESSTAQRKAVTGASKGSRRAGAAFGVARSSEAAEGGSQGMRSAKKKRRVE